MNPTSGSFTINPRLQRHFAVFAICFPGQDSLTTIYSSILTQHYANAEQKFNGAVTKVTHSIVSASLSLHSKVAQVFLPTAVKFHYIFNLRDMSNVYQGLLFSTSECLTTASDVVRLWLHESHRVYGDKFTDDKDIDAFTKMQTDIVKKSVEELDESLVFDKPNIFCHFAGGIGEPKYMPVSYSWNFMDLYNYFLNLKISDWQNLTKLLQEAQAAYNDIIATMNLVLFEDAMNYVCRINRILELPRGNALLVGVGGSGKQSLSRLGAFISSLEVSQIQLKKGYGIPDLKVSHL
jgi:dynein heavy chain